MSTPPIRWQIVGDYFENCNCDVVCPCVFSPGPLFTARPTNGFCEVAFAFHVDQGRYGEVTLDGLNAIVMVRSPGTMADGNWSVAVYLDDRTDGRQREALQTIFTGSAGVPWVVWRHSSRPCLVSGACRLATRSKVSGALWRSPISCT